MQVFRAPARPTRVRLFYIPTFAGMSKIPTKDLKMSEIPGILSGYTVV
jgi:hypothetical protein